MQLFTEPLDNRVKLPLFDHIIEKEEPVQEEALPRGETRSQPHKSLHGLCYKGSLERAAIEQE